ncbi:MAG: hypothetical protein WKG06_36260 [Segetibacter sp.]
MSFIKNILILLFFLTVTVSSFAEREQIDSLKKVLPALKDSARIDCLSALSKAYIWVNTDSSRLLAAQALKAAETLGYIKGIANSYNNLAWITRLMADDYPRMEMYCKKAIALLEKTPVKNILPTRGFCWGLHLQHRVNFLHL